MGSMARIDGARLAERVVLVLGDAHHAAAALEPEHKHDLHPVLLHDLELPTADIGRNLELQLSPHAPRQLAQVIELQHQLDGRDPLRQPQLPSQGRQLLQQEGYRLQVGLVLGISVLCDPMRHGIASLKDLLATVITIIPILRELQTVQPDEPLEAEACGAESQPFHLPVPEELIMIPILGVVSIEVGLVHLLLLLRPFGIDFDHHI